MAKNAYVHIPFCRSKCRYCSFVSYPELDKIEQYLNFLLQEIKFFYKKEKLNTLYIGGGTPSLLNVSDIEKIVSGFDYESDAEITMELNPETLTYDYFAGLRKIGINRISLGCQTFDDNILKLIGRRHNSVQVISAVKAAQKAGFYNINLDFIYGLPAQTIEGFVCDLKKGIDLDVKHISLYGLKIDEGCYFAKHPPEELIDEDMQADMYIKAIETLSDFEHYEISNFARRGYHSRHNLNYWDNNSYYGFGIAAHGYVDGVRYSNFCDFDGYFKNPLHHAVEQRLTEQEKLEEEIFLGFRRMKGINFQTINSKFNINFEKKYSKILEKYFFAGFLEKTDYGCKLTTSGVLVSNVILSEFLQ